MFRRKDENSDSPLSATDAATGHTDSASPATHSAAPVTVPASSPLASTAGAATSAARPAAEAPRAASTPGTYRPTPMAELGRPPARPGEPAPRPGAPAVAGFGGNSVNLSEKALSIKTNRRVLTVGNDILLKGEIATCDRLVIEGRVEARLSEVHTVEIAECGSFKGTAEVEDAEISGVFEGDLVVRNRMVIYATGEVRGNISYGEIEIERGGRLMGEIKTVTGNTPTAKPKSFEAVTGSGSTPSGSTQDKDKARKDSVAAA